MPSVRLNLGLSEAKRNDGQAFSVLRWRLDQLLLDAARDEFAVSSRKIMQGMSRRFWFTHCERAQISRRQ